MVLQNQFYTLLSSSKTHLHIAVVHDTAYNIFIISFRVIKIIQIRGLGFKTSTMILFILPYPVFIFCSCFSSMFYVKGIIHRCFYTIWSLRHMFCQLYWAGEFSSSWYISLCLVPGTLIETGDSLACVVSSFHFKHLLKNWILAKFISNSAYL